MRLFSTTEVRSPQNGVVLGRRPLFLCLPTEDQTNTKLEEGYFDKQEEMLMPTCSRLSTVLRRQPVRDLREDPLRQAGVAAARGDDRQGPGQEAAGPGSDQEARVYEGRS